MVVLFLLCLSLPFISMANFTPLAEGSPFWVIPKLRENLDKKKESNLVFYGIGLTENLDCERTMDKLYLPFQEELNLLGLHLVLWTLPEHHYPVSLERYRELRFDLPSLYAEDFQKTFGDQNVHVKGLIGFSSSAAIFARMIHFFTNLQFLVLISPSFAVQMKPHNRFAFDVFLNEYSLYPLNLLTHMPDHCAMEKFHYKTSHEYWDKAYPRFAGMDDFSRILDFSWPFTLSLKKLTFVPTENYLTYLDPFSSKLQKPSVALIINKRDPRISLEGLNDISKQFKKNGFPLQTHHFEKDSSGFAEPHAPMLTDQWNGVFQFLESFICDALDQE